MSAARLLPEETIRQVVGASDIVEVVGAHLALRKVGATFTSLCPFHQEKSPSFVVTPARQSFKCFGCGAGGDALRFVMLMDNVAFPEAVRVLAERGGIPLPDSTSMVNPTDPEWRQKPVAVPASKPKQRAALSVDLRRGSRSELHAVAHQRGLSLAGMELASARGLLRFGSLRGLPAWIVTDAARLNAQARRLDGGLWAHIGGKKAYTLPGAWAGWPIGVKEADAFSFVALVEGGPDLLAAHHFIVAEGRENDVAAVAMLGAANHIPEDALLLLAHKRVRIFPHADAAGQDAAARWAAALERVGCEVDAFRFDGLRRADGAAVKDLNDLALLDADCFEAEQAELAEVLPQ